MKVLIFFLIFFLTPVEEPVFIELGKEIEDNKYEILLVYLSEKDPRKVKKTTIDTIVVHPWLVTKINEDKKIINWKANLAYLKGKEYELYSYQKVKYQSSQLWLKKWVIDYLDKVVFDKEKKELTVVRTVTKKEEKAPEALLIMTFLLITSILVSARVLLPENCEKLILFSLILALVFFVFSWTLIGKPVLSLLASVLIFFLVLISYVQKNHWLVFIITIVFGIIVIFVLKSISLFFFLVALVLVPYIFFSILKKFGK